MKENHQKKTNHLLKMSLKGSRKENCFKLTRVKDKPILKYKGRRHLPTGFRRFLPDSQLLYKSRSLLKSNEHKSVATDGYDSQNHGTHMRSETPVEQSGDWRVSPPKVMTSEKSLNHCARTLHLLPLVFRRSNSLSRYLLAFAYCAQPIGWSASCIEVHAAFVRAGVS